jgi:membrane-associated protein
MQNTNTYDGADSKWKEHLLRLSRHSGAGMLLAKFIIGSNVVSLLAGRAGMSAVRFFMYDSIGSFMWSGGYLACGYLLDGRLHWVLAQT